MPASLVWMLFTARLPFGQRIYLELSGEISAPLNDHERRETGGMLPSVRQSKRTEGVSTSTSSSETGGGRTKAASPPTEERGEERERERGRERARGRDGERERDVIQHTPIKSSVHESGNPP